MDITDMPHFLVFMDKIDHRPFTLKHSVPVKLVCKCPAVYLVIVFASWSFYKRRSHNIEGHNFTQ